MKERLNLLLAIRERGYRQRDFSRIVGAQESLVSEVISGKKNIDVATQTQWARALGKKPDEIFQGETQ